MQIGEEYNQQNGMGRTCFGEYAVLIAVIYNSHAAPTDGSEAEATTTHAVNDAGLNSLRDCTVLFYQLQYFIMYYAGIYVVKLFAFTYCTQ